MTPWMSNEELMRKITEQQLRDKYEKEVTRTIGVDLYPQGSGSENFANSLTPEPGAVGPQTQMPPPQMPPPQTPPISANPQNPQQYRGATNNPFAAKAQQMGFSDYRQPSISSMANRLGSMFNRGGDRNGRQAAQAAALQAAQASALRGAENG